MLSNKLKEYRSKTKITQEDLAEQLCVSRSAVAKWEQGKGIPSKQSLKDLEELMGVSQEELLQEDEHYQIIEKGYFSYKNIVFRKCFLLDIHKGMCYHKKDDETYL